MGWEEQVEEEEEGGGIPDPSRLSVKGKPLRNKSLSVGFDEKGLRDFITGFHKRKKRRQKEAQQQLEEKARKLRIEQRKKKKLEIQLAYGGGPVNPGTVPDDPRNEIEEDGEDFHGPSITGTTVYNNGSSTITVTTSELCGEENKDVHMWDHVAERHAIPIKERVLKVIKTHAKLSRKANVLKQAGSARKPGKGLQRHGGERKGIKGSKKQVGKWENMAHGSRQAKGKRKVRK
ncbi:uncharacterized protein LOC116252906 isoform X1 [Nymphaea colorata]|nr:uncharacterized protein LOC116252906 isoform X1 [Nymphaea colorata]